jgi:hypothetical protein
LLAYYEKLVTAREKMTFGEMRASATRDEIIESP